MHSSDSSFSLQRGLFQRLVERADEGRDDPLFVFVGRNGHDGPVLGARALVEGSARLAAHLRHEEGLAPGDRVVLLYGLGPRFIEALLACIWAGLVPVPVAPLDPVAPTQWAETIGRIHEDCGARAVLTDKKSARVRHLDAMTTLAASGEHAWLRERWIDTSRPRGHARLIDPGPPGESIALIQYTSGSTGHPKGVCVTVANLVHQLEANHRVLGLGPQSIGVLWLPHFHDFSLISGILSNLALVGRLYLMSPMTFVHDPALWFRVIDRVRGTHTAAPDFGYRALGRAVKGTDVAGWDLRCLTVCMSAAEPIRDQTVRTFLDRLGPCGLSPDAFCPAYGLAEHTVGVTVGGRDALSLDRDALAHGRAIVGHEDGGRRVWSCGRPLPGVDLRIVDPTSGTAHEDGQIGEIWVDSPSRAPRYWGDEALTRARLHAKLAGQEHRAYLRTGDLGFVHEGELYVTGRHKEMMIVRGRNLYPHDVEASVRESLASHGLERVFAFTAAEDGAEQICVLAERTGPSDPSLEDFAPLADRARAAVARRHQVALDVFGLVDPGVLPYSSSGKPRRRECAHRWSRGTLPTAARTHFDPRDTPPAFTDEPTLGARPSQAQLEALVRAQIANANGCDEAQVDLRTPVEALGLDSLTLFALVGQLSRHLGRLLSPSSLTEYPDLATLIEAELAKTPCTAPPVAATVPVWPTSLRITESQRAFAEQTRLLPGSFENVFAFRLDPRAEPATVAAALDVVARLHPGLRTATEEHGPFIRDGVDPSVLAGVHRPRALEDLPAQLAAEVAEPLDPSRAAVRWRLLRSSKETILLMRVGHIGYDARTSPAMLACMQAQLDLHVFGQPKPPPTLAWPGGALVQAEQAYLNSPARAADREFWCRQSSRLPPWTSLDLDVPLARVAPTPVGSAAALRARAAAHGGAPNATLLCAFGHAVADVLGVDALAVGIAVDLRALYGTKDEVPCAVHWVPVCFERGISPAELHRRSLRAAAHARLPNRELRAACGFWHIHPPVMFYSYADFEAAPRPSNAGRCATITECIDTSALPVARPNQIQGFVRLVGDAVVFDARARVGAEVLAERMRAALEQY